MKEATQSAYVAAHKQLRRVRGPATKYRCISCRSKASDWAYQGGAAEEFVVQGTSRVFSLDHSRYSPMCRPCHFRKDGHGVGQKHTEETRNLLSEQAKKRALDPEYRKMLAKNGKAVGEVMSARKRKCSCGKTSNPGAISIHQKYTGHTGFEDLK